VKRTTLAVVLACLLGIPTGVGAFTFVYAKGFSYLSTDPRACVNCHVGDVFVVRVAGNVVSGSGASVKGSVEYAIAELNVPLIVVMGHSSCGAVKAALKHIDARDSLPGAINDLVELIKPAVVRSKGASGDPLDRAIRENVVIGVDRLRGLEPIVAVRVKEGSVKAVGAVYDLATGKVSVVTG